MADGVKVELDTSALSTQMQGIKEELTSLVEEDLNPLALSLQAIFQEMSTSIIDDLENAAAQGKLSIRGMVNDILEDVAKLAAEQLIGDPLTAILSGNGSSSILNTSSSIQRSNGQSATLLSQLLRQAGRNG